MSTTILKIVTTDAISGQVKDKKLSLTANAGSIADGQTITISVHEIGDVLSGQSINLTKEQALLLAIEIQTRFVQPVDQIDGDTLDNRKERREANNWSPLKEEV